MLRSSVGTAASTDVAAESRVGISVGADCGVGDGAERGSAHALAAVGCGGGVGMGLAVLSAGRVAMGVGNGDVWLFDPTGVAGGTVGGAGWVG